MGGYRPFPNVAAKNLVQERLEVPVLIRALGIPRGRRMLEVGCGRGVALPTVARLCTPSRLTGVDIDRELLSEAAERLAETGTEAELVPADVRALPFADASFDVVLDFGTVYHITGAELALGEVARVLAPGGVFVHETPLAQFVAHPVRALGHGVPWSATPELRRDRHAGLWAARVKLAAGLGTERHYSPDSVAADRCSHGAEAARQAEQIEAVDHRQTPLRSVREPKLQA